MVLMIN